ncbi:Mth938-like domain-containing protein [Methylosinus sp. Sm6]|uniref:Mth938-like domain-containing protein n=1 Tax=Methylosinus sp. Sm6 TaxID=2866948 RepID=UPI001C9995CF|nr:MTH938/NDUFAF3 family protein [Methylosinus sp. Sm6]MBY6241926.1 MTH938/NDUFAF3 family protein [Methylosinus sp. Sm6]
MAEHGQGFVPGRHRIEAYGGGGFRFADMSHRGSLLALPSGVHAIDAAEAAAVTEGTLAPLLAEPPGTVELLIFGAGANLRPLGAALHARLRARGIMVEAMATGPAVRTYNMLVDEDRRVAAVLIAV